jgi:hypothetical protein
MIGTQTLGSVFRRKRAILAVDYLWGRCRVARRFAALFVSHQLASSKLVRRERSLIRVALAPCHAVRLRCWLLRSEAYVAGLRPVLFFHDRRLFPCCTGRGLTSRSTRTLLGGAFRRRPRRAG